MKNYRPQIVAAGGGVAILLLVLTTLVAKLTVDASQALLVIFGGLLIAAPLIARFTFGKDGLVFETLAPQISETLATHDQAIKTINENFIKLTHSLEELSRKLEANSAQEAGAPADYTAMAAKIIDITSALARNKTVIDLGAASTQKVKELIGASS